MGWFFYIYIIEIDQKSDKNLIIQLFLCILKENDYFYVIFHIFIDEYE